ncbi:MAG: hypothetical protein HYY17_06720 [Planctomycetes bacterium]|nr:hypothetical protein [Planctomycetota bacterium]
MKKRLRFYFETSVWRRLVEEPSSLRRTLSYRLMTVARRRHVILASREVARELGEISDGALRKRALDRFRRTAPEMVTTRPLVRDIAEELLRRGGWGDGDLAGHAPHRIRCDGRSGRAGVLGQSGSGATEDPASRDGFGSRMGSAGPGYRHAP